MTEEKRKKITSELQQVINRNSFENESNTPDWILAEHLMNCLELLWRGAINSGFGKRNEMDILNPKPMSKSPEIRYPEEFKKDGDSLAGKR
jgi:hypothetical protein